MRVPQVVGENRTLAAEGEKKDSMSQRFKVLVHVVWE